MEKWKEGLIILILIIILLGLLCFSIFLLERTVSFDTNNNPEPKEEKYTSHNITGIVRDIQFFQDKNQTGINFLATGEYVEENLTLYSNEENIRWLWLEGDIDINSIVRRNNTGWVYVFWVSNDNPCVISFHYRTLDDKNYHICSYWYPKLEDEFYTLVGGV